MLENRENDDLCFHEFLLEDFRCACKYYYTPKRLAKKIKFVIYNTAHEIRLQPADQTIVERTYLKLNNKTY